MGQGIKILLMSFKLVKISEEVSAPQIDYLKICRILRGFNSPLTYLKNRKPNSLTKISSITRLLIFDTTSLFNPFSTNVSLMNKPGSWFLLAKCLKNTCVRVTF